MNSDTRTCQSYADSPWKDADLMRELYEDEMMTHAEIADEFGCAPSTITNWMVEHDIKARNSTADAQGGPWTDAELMEELYVEEQRSATEIGDIFDCSPTTVNVWLEKHDNIEKRSRRESQFAWRGLLNSASFLTREFGHEVWQHDGNTVLVHRLLAVSEFGFEALYGKVVHHKSHIPWDNRPDNIELMEHGKHTTHHKRKITGIDRLRVAELYEHGTISSRSLGDVFDVSGGSVLRIHGEFYGGEV